MRFPVFYKGPESCSAGRQHLNRSIVLLHIALGYRGERLLAAREIVGNTFLEVRISTQSHHCFL